MLICGGLAADHLLTDIIMTGSTRTYVPADRQNNHYLALEPAAQDGRGL